MEILRRTLSALLALVMVVTMLPLSALAEETDPTITETTAETEPVDVGEVVLDVPLAVETEPAETVPEIFVEETATAMASDVPTSGTCGENVTWTLVDGVLTISGEGDMCDYIPNNIPWYNQRKEIMAVEVGNGITSIGDYAFWSCTSMTNILIPHGITSIGHSSFFSCQNIKEITLPDSVIFIGESAFYDCRRLTSITIPNGVTSISDSTFSSCDSLISVILPDSITSVGQEAFSNCKRLTTIKLPDNVASIGSGAFRACYNLVSITIPYGVTSIAATTFRDCESLTSIVIPGSVTFIGNAAFEDCKNLKEITIPNGVTSIGDSTFYGCTSLMSVEIPECTTFIGMKAFCDCRSLTSIAIPKSVTFIGASAFWGCNSLTNISLSCGITSISDYLLYRCENLACVILPDGVTSIGKNAFSYCSSLISISLSDDITSIGDSAFFGCTKLASISIPDSVTVIYSNAFSKCENLQDIYYSGNQEQWVDLINYCGTHIIPESVTIHFNNTGPGEVVPPEATEPKEEGTVQEYLNSSDIKINGSGSAFSYYLGEANQVYQLTVDGKAQTITATEKGVLRIPLGTFQTIGTETIPVEFTHVGGKALSEPQTFLIDVQVTPVEFSQSWKASLDASVGAKLIAGAEVPIVNLEASLGAVSGKVGAGAAMNISRSYSASGETLVITTDKRIEAGVTVKCGITGEALSTKFNSGLSLNSGGSDTISYGLKVRNYSAANKSQQRAIGTYLLGELLDASPGDAWYIPFYKHLAEIVYDDSGCAVVHGSASKLRGAFGAGVGSVTVNGVDIANVLNGKVEASIIQSVKSISDGTQEKSMSAKLSANLSTVTPLKSAEDGEIGMDSSLLRGDFLGRDVKITAEQYGHERKIESTSLSSNSTQIKIMEIGIPATAVYNKYIFKDEALNGLLSNTSSFDDYLNKSLFVLSLADLCEMADVISTSEAPIEYKSETKRKVALSIPLEFDLGIGAGISFGTTLSYLEDSSYTSGTGYVVNDEVILTSESDDLSYQVKKNSRELVEIFNNCMAVLAEDAANFFKSVGNAIQEGVETTWSWIEGKASNVANWFISITYAPSVNDGPWDESMKIGILGSYVNFSLARQAANPNDAYVTRTAMTVGRPFVVNVTDNTTGEAIGNFEEAPLEFTIRYAGEDLMAANYDAETQVISMYRYSDDGDYFEYIGGIHDADAMTVTAMITKPGQYILAAEAIEEEEPGEDTHEYSLGDVNHDNKINAKDATLILQSSVGVLKETAKFCETCAEVSGDGKLNAKDSTLILQFSVGLRDSFPAAEK